jgi:mRNA interferase MazF
LKLGEIWAVAGGGDYGGKPGPVVILQDDRFDMTESATVCAFTTDPTDAPLFRLVVEPSIGNGLHTACRVMVDKITTVRKAKLGRHIGRLADEDIVRLNRAVLVFLGITGPAAD